MRDYLCKSVADNKKKINMKQLLTLKINGETHEVWTSTHKTLLEVLREDLYLTGTKHGCELGECGACSVLIDGEPVLACLILPVEVQGQEIQTIEGLAKRGFRIHCKPLLQNKAHRNAVTVLRQC